MVVYHVHPGGGEGGEGEDLSYPGAAEIAGEGLRSAKAEGGSECLKIPAYLRRKDSCLLKKGGHITPVAINDGIGIGAAGDQGKGPGMPHHLHSSGLQDIPQGLDGRQGKDEITQGTLMNDEDLAVTQFLWPKGHLR